nr:reverse transcriptase domain-containing protein [Tanacetum cinerariifolium]
MADQCTIAELIRAPTEGYAEEIAVPLILAEHFVLKHSLINMMTLDQFFGLEKDNPHDHIHLLRACPHHGFTELHQLDTFYNALNPADQDSLNSATGGNLLERRTQDVLTIIENKSKCLTADGNTFLEFRDNIQGYVSAAAINYNQAVILKKLPKKLRDRVRFLILCGFSELKCKALADLGASISLMPLSVWKKLGLPELISTRMTLELAKRAICTRAGIARDVFVPVGKFTFPADFVIVDNESDPRVPLILERPFLRTARALIDVHREEMILHDGDERLTLNMRHDTSSYSKQPKKESINMINIYDDSYEDYLEDLFATNHLSGNPTFSSHTNLTSPEVINPLSGSTTSSSPDHLLEEKWILILKDSVNEDNLADPNNDLFDTIPEMFTDEHTLDYSSPPLYDDFDDDLDELESDNDDAYNDPFDSKEDKIKVSKLLIDELDPLRSSDFLPSPKYDSFLFEDFFEVDALPSTNNEDKDFNPPLYEHPFHKEVLGSETLLSFSSENEENVFKPGILTSKGVHTSLHPELYHRGPKAFKIFKIFESPMEIFPCSHGEDIRILDVPCLHFYPP